MVVGLGNPGKRYARTPHNAGFDVVDTVARSLSCDLRGSWRFKARLGKTVFREEELWLVKPETFMNLSGEAVGAILRYHKGAPGDLVVVLDDADLELGRLRIRAKGSSGGHRGLDSIIAHVGSHEFPRVRVGIGRGDAEEGLVDRVLSPLTATEQPVLDEAVSRASEAVICLLESGVESAMNRFNAKATDLEKGKQQAGENEP